jgi:phosphate-selective porin OprO/OprP
MNTPTHLKKHLHAAVAAALMLPIISFADDASDPTARIQQLEKMMQQMQQQRAEQDKQMQTMAEELKAMQQQMANGKEERVKEKGKSSGSPVYAAFKDGLVFDDGTGNWALQINGRIQGDYRTIDPSQWKSDTFSIRRARLGGTFTFLKDFQVRVEGEYANSNDGAKGTTGLTYGYVEYKHFPGARVRVGQFKPVFGLERAESTNFTDFQELSMATANGSIFNSTYDRGIMLFGAPFKGTYYNLSYVNGSGQNNDGLKDAKDVIGRVSGNIADWAEWKNAVVHVGLSGGRGTQQPTTVTGGSTLTSFTESNGITSSSSATSTATTNNSSLGTRYFLTTAFDGQEIDKSRIGFETALAYGPVKLQGEYITANFEGTTSAKMHFDKDINAWYVDLNWMVTGEKYADSYKDGMFGRIIPKQNFALDKEGFGAIELGLRYSKFDASDFHIFNAAPSSPVKGTGIVDNSGSTKYTNQAYAWTGGIKWVLMPNARLMLNYIHTSFDTPVTINGKSSDSEEAVTMRAQYDF